MPEIITGLVAGGATGIWFATGIGIAMGFVVYSRLRIIHRYHVRRASPYKFTSCVEKADASLVTDSKAMKYDRKGTAQTDPLAIEGGTIKVIKEGEKPSFIN